MTMLSETYTSETNNNLLNLEDLYPLSPMQQGMLFHTVYAPESGVYVSMSVFTIDGKLDITAFERSWQKVVERHSILRTSFLWEDLEKPVQIVHRHVILPFEQVDCCDLNVDEQETILGNYIASARKRGFDLGKAPLMRLALFRWSNNIYKFVFCWHHLLLDRWSRSLVMKEVFAFYEAFRNGGDPALEEARPYGDYIAWLDEQDVAAAESYWRSCLEGVTEPTSLAIERKSTDLPDESKTYDHQSIQLSEASTDRLKTFAREHKFTLNTVVQGTWALILSRYSGSDDVLFGVTASGRPPGLRGVESMVGLFINTLPLRVRVPSHSDVLSWLNYVQDQQFTLQQYGDSSLLDIQGWSQVPRGVPLFENILVFENIPVSSSFQTANGGLEIRSQGGFGATGYPLLVTVNPGERLMIHINYDLARFEHGSVGRMLGHFETLLQGITEKPEERLAELPWLTEAEREQLLVEWNQTKTEYPKNRCTHELFEEQVKRTPERVAVVSGDEQLTYDELNRRSNQLGHYLRKRGVGPEVLVGICMERSLELLVGLLGILKAGGAYVPIDPAYPEERLVFILNDAGAKVLLTQRELLAALPGTTAEVVCLDSDWGAITREGTANAAGKIAPENLAYVIYTSGSTGQPKGVAIEHRSTVAFLHWATSEFTSLELERVLASTSLCFDLSVFELLAPLCMGGSVVVVENALHLPGLPSADEVTLINTVPSAMAELVRIGGIPSSVRTVNLAGEALRGALVQKIYEQKTIGEVVNLYGPSEDTTYSTFTRLPRGVGGEPSVGRPIANTEVYLLDSNMEPVPVGVPGELYLGGAGLARGYLNRRELTAEKFVPSPFSREAGARLYSTGDLARYQADGSIQFLGRLDHQVKVRGYRVELGEIEAALKHSAAVRDVVVVAKQDGAGHASLVAYIVPTTDQATLTRAELVGKLRVDLKKRLPDYMMPSVFVVLKELPLTPNGKVDRRALPEVSQAPGAPEKVEVAKTELEVVLTEIWQRLLSVRPIGLSENFFDLGGHSLLALRMVAEIEKATGKKIPLVSLFQNGTIQQIATVLRKERELYPWPALVQIQPGKSGAPLFCVSAPNVNALGYVFLARYLGPDQPVYGLQAQYPEDLEGEHSQFAVEELATEYLEALRKTQPEGPYQFLGMCRGAHIAHEMARRLQQQGHKVAMLGVLDTWVIENTYSYFWYLEHYLHRLLSLLRMKRRERVALISEKARHAAEALAGARSGGANGRAATQGGNRLREAYFPGPHFAPKIYNGRISVFRARRQPFNRIRDPQLGWGRLASSGVDVHLIPGKHGGSVLREPLVQVLAAEVKKCLLDNSD